MRILLIEDDIVPPRGISLMLNPAAPWSITLTRVRRASS
jgi:hypothetical protein